MTSPRPPGLQPTLLTIPDDWTPETALAVFTLIDDLRDQIWSAYAAAIQAELQSELDGR